MESWTHMYTDDEMLIEGPSPACPPVQRYRQGLRKGHLEEANSYHKGFTCLLERGRGR